MEADSVPDLKKPDAGQAGVKNHNRPSMPLGVMIGIIVSLALVDSRSALPIGDVDILS